ncbi:MAG: MaoC/PaaZ C-terminal domain-containing protein [Gammaproteobacteria bacterium]|nr:MaoC/PaaZ C-terminal domain-containing protein [Gammaproteobacteria bacterium]
MSKPPIKGSQLGGEVIEPIRLKPLWQIYLSMFLGLKKESTDLAAPLPDVVYIQRGRRVSQDDMLAYQQVCGASPPDLVPPIYPHIMATHLQLQLMDSEHFPFSLAGLVHMGQSIEWHADMPINGSYDVVCKIEGPRETDRGWEFTLLTDVLKATERVWHEKIDFLKPDPKKRARPRRHSRSGDAVHFVPLLHLQFEEDMGRRYARVSGDWNPIHLSRFLAKRFGFKRPIAHGMFSLARCLSILQARGVELNGMKLEGSFRAPVMLPAYTNFSLGDREPDRNFALTDARKGRILVEGHLSELN